MNSNQAVRVLVSGRVQGVGFRYFVQTRARQYGLCGYVRNLPDGGVEALAAGERVQLEAFVQDLQQGPPASRVRQCLVSWEQDVEPGTEFSIRP